MIVEFIKEWSGLIMGAMGMVGSIYVHFSSNRRLSEQQKQINELQLASLEQEAQDKKKAVLNVKCQKLSSPGSYKLLVANAGSVSADNVRLKIVTPIYCISDNNDTQDYKRISPQDVRKDIILHKVTSDPDEFDIELSWDDSFKKGNVERRTIGYN